MYLFYVFILCVLAFATYSYKNDRFLNSICSLIWLVLMASPFLMQYNTFHVSFRDTQLVGILLIGFAFLTAELLFFTKHKDIAREENISINTHVVYACAIVIVTIQLSHLILMPNIPIFTYLLNFKNDKSLTILREASSKLLHVPEILKYVYQTSNIIAPCLALILLFRNKWLGLLFILFTLFYSVATTAKTMGILYIAILLIPVYFSNKKIRVTINTLSLLATYILVSLSVVFYLQTKPDNKEYLNIEMQSPRTYTLGDQFRTLGLMPFETQRDTVIPATLTRLKGLFYRAVLVPAEVSQVWYAYYPKVKGQFISTYGLLPSDRKRPDFVHPSNEVGIWGYVNKYPKDYLPSIHAYSSIDAEIYSRFGIAGIFVVSLLLLFIVYSLQSSNMDFKSNDLLIFKVSALLILALYSPMSSLQAMLFAHGLLVIFFILIAVHFYKKLNSKKMR